MPSCKGCFQLMEFAGLAVHSQDSQWTLITQGQLNIYWNNLHPPLDSPKLEGKLKLVMLTIWQQHIHHTKQTWKLYQIIICHYLRSQATFI